jgi:hypothetical protein
MWHWQEAVKAVFSGKVTVVEVYPDVTIRAANLEIPLPSVIALNEYVQQPNNVRLYAASIYLQSCRLLTTQFPYRNQHLPSEMFFSAMNTGANTAVTDFILVTCRWIMSCLDAWAVDWFGKYRLISCVGCGSWFLLTFT